MEVEVVVVGDGVELIDSYTAAAVAVVGIEDNCIVIPKVVNKEQRRHSLKNSMD